MITIHKKLFVFIFGFSILFLFSLHAQAQIKPWNEITTTSRFQPITFSGGAGILDRESGIIFAANPSAALPTWYQANNSCNALMHEGKWGWRLPSVQELSNLNSSTYPGTLFTGTADILWSGTTVPDDPTGLPNLAYAVDTVTGAVLLKPKAETHHFICVRGGNAP